MCYEETKKEKGSGEEVKCNCKLHEEHGRNRYCRSVHSNILLPSEDTKLVLKIILLGIEIVVINRNILYTERCKEKTPINESYQVQATAGHDPCRGFPSRWW
jgi:hypothetical protein